MSDAGEAELPELNQERFESLAPPARVLAELLPYRPILLDGRLHGAVVLRLRASGTWVEYVECSARTSAAMVVDGNDRAVVLRRSHDPIDRLCVSMVAAAAVLVGWAAMLGVVRPTGIVAWGLCAMGLLSAATAAALAGRVTRLRGGRERWAVSSQKEWETTLAALEPMVTAGSTTSDLVAEVDRRVRFSE